VILRGSGRSEETTVASDRVNRAERSSAHNNIDYCLDEPDDWPGAVAAFEQFRQDDGSTIVLRGICPRCRGTMTVELPIQARAGQTIGEARDNQALPPGKSFVKVASCNCGQHHSNQPEKSLGCGAFGSLRVGGGPEGAAERPRSRYLRVNPVPGEATVNDVEWERRAEQHEIEALPAARATAEKWTTQIASLTGIFSIVVLVKGPEDVAHLEGHVGRLAPSVSTLVALIVTAVTVAFVLFAYRQWPEQAWADSTTKWTAQVLAVVSIATALLIWDRQAGWPATAIALVLAVGLPAAAQFRRPRYLFAGDVWPQATGRWPGLRGKTPGAARWTARLVGLACALSVALIWAQDWTWETAVIVSLALALTFAALAVVAGGLAAYGIPARFAPASGGLMRTSQRAAIQRARNSLRVSLGGAIGAIVSVAVAIAATWINTPAESSPGAVLLVTRTNQPPICGRYAGEEAGDLLIQERGRTAPTRIRLDALISTASLPSCPED
jgi:hypothetical protein